MVLLVRTTGLEDYFDGGDANIKALIMGNPGVGKTPYASFWPDPILADCEKGRMSVAYRKIPYAEILTVEDMDALLQMLSLECRKPPAQRRFKTLIIDTIDAYQRLIIQKRLDTERKEALSGWGDWGYLDAKMTQFIARLHQLPMNIVVNLHVTERNSSTDDDSKITGPKLKGDYKDQIAAEFDLVGYMGTFWEAEGGERVLKRGIQWHADPTKPMLKDRTHMLPKWTPVTFSEDDFAELLGHLTRGMDELSDSEVLDELETDEAITVAPVGPLPGGAVPDAAMTPGTAPAKKAAAKKAAPPAAKSASAPVASPVAVPPAASRVTSPNIPAEKDTPTAVVADSGADPAPGLGEPGLSETSQSEPGPGLDEAAKVAADGLGGTVISEPEPVDASVPEAQAAEAAVEAPSSTASAAWPLCGTSSDEDQAGQPGQVAGCGAPVDPDLDSTQIAIFKTRTYLCPADFAAWRATTRK